MMLIACKGILGFTSEDIRSGHAEGALRFLQARGGLKPRNEFEQKMFIKLRWGIVCLSLSFPFSFPRRVDWFRISTVKKKKKKKIGTGKRGCACAD